MFDWELLRLANVALALITIALHISLLRTAGRAQDFGAFMFALSVTVWCAAYTIAASSATFSQPSGPAGPWTTAFSAALGFSLIVGVWMLNSHRIERRHG